jgi:hypothetical protein
MAKFSKSELVEHAWEITKQNFWFLFWLAFIIMLAGSIPNLFGQEVQQTNFFWVLVLIIWIVQIFLSLGIIRISLKLSRSETASWGDLWEPRHLFWRYLGASILYGLITVIGFILLIIPGLIISIRLQFFTYALVDKEMKIFEALQYSWDITRGSWWNLFFYNIILTLIVFLGLILLVVGVLVATPVTWLAYTLVYLKLSDQLALTAKTANNLPAIKPVANPEK